MTPSTRCFTTLCALAMILAGTSPAKAETSWGVSMNIGKTPPPLVVVVKEEPRLVAVPGTTIRVVNDSRYGYDCFQYGAYWYACNDGYWYRSRARRGPFVTVEERRVPRAIFQVPTKHWKHHPHGGAPGLAKRQHGHDAAYAGSRPQQVVVVKGKQGRGGHKGH